MKVDNALVLSPHTDDMELGAGGTVRKLVECGIHVKSIVFSDCKESVDTSVYGEDTLRKECKAAAAHLGVKDLEILEIPVREFPKHRQAILETIYKARKKLRPDLVLTSWVNDLHQDHRTVACETARAFMKSSSSVWSYQVPGACPGFNPQLFVILNDRELDEKIEMLYEYESQVGRRLYFDKQKLRGFMEYFGTFAGVRYAEGFVQNRGIIHEFAGP